MIKMIGNDTIQIKTLEDNSLEIKDIITSNTFYMGNENLDGLIEVLIKAKELFQIEDKDIKMSVGNCMCVPKN